MPRNHGTAKVALERMTRAYELVDWVGHSLQDATFTASDRTRTAAACFAIAQEHHAAIVTLTEHQMFTSAFSLGRIVFDAYVRGAWLAKCASETRVTKFFNADREPDGMKDMIASLQKIPEYSNGWLQRMKESSWEALCDYTHTGGRQVQRWNTTDAIEPDYRIEEVLELLGFAEIVAVMSVASLALLLDDSTLYDEARLKLDSVMNAVERETASVSPKAGGEVNLP
jgi:hypothetical protein